MPAARKLVNASYEIKEAPVFGSYRIFALPAFCLYTKDAADLSSSGSGC